MNGRKAPPRKDRLIQTRVPQNLESTLKDEARRRRLSVSHLIRNVLEDTFNLVDNVVVEVDKVVHDSVGMAQTLRRDARKLAASARGDTDARSAIGEDPAAEEEAASSAAAPTEAKPGEASEAEAEGPAEAPAETPVEEATGPAASPEPPIEISAAARQPVAWMPAVVNQDASCCNCAVELPRGKEAFLGLAPAGSPSPHWLCPRCRSAL